jgi:hypothetical protein
MIVSFDIDGVLTKVVWISDEEWACGGKDQFYATVLDVELRFPELVPYINRLTRHHVVQFNSAREPFSEKDTVKWAHKVGFNRKIWVNCLGKEGKLRHLHELQPALHFDDHRGFREVPGFVHVWNPSWAPAPEPGQIGTAEEIIERIAYEKSQRYDGIETRAGSF